MVSTSFAVFFTSSSGPMSAAKAAIVAKGIKEIKGDIVGDDSYFPRDRYPNGWEIDDMVWEYGAAISAIV